MSGHDQAVRRMLGRPGGPPDDPASLGRLPRVGGASGGRSSAQVERDGALLMSEHDEVAWW
ncbi:hypothetical protein [Kribbella voronezhensis]|uniref:hypothetical protein n=1 Tax=Kribbella voronezhensis TaxID=2512212 RepID=UPI001063188C|nr:hypothetical protein [Kribbella voronezhensis]